MRKLSEAQVKALDYVNQYGNRFNPDVRGNTWTALDNGGLITGDVTTATVTEWGREQYAKSTGNLLVAPVSKTPVALDREIQTVVTALHTPGDREEALRQAFRDHLAVLEPVSEAPRSHKITRGHRPVADVQALRDDLLTPVNGHAMTEAQADEILDRWETVPNRADRRQAVKDAGAKGRRGMRRSVTPTRRRFTSEVAKLRKAERRILTSVPGDRQADALAAL